MVRAGGEQFRVAGPGGHPLEVLVDLPSRDDLLTALIVDAYDAYDAYDAVGEAAERAAARTGEAVGWTGRWVAVASAVRTWAPAHPHEYALIYGSPVPGYPPRRRGWPPPSSGSSATPTGRVP